MEELMKEIKQFNEERDWDKFHSPENLAKSISIEANELLEFDNGIKAIVKLMVTQSHGIKAEGVANLHHRCAVSQIADGRGAENVTGIQNQRAVRIFGADLLIKTRNFGGTGTVIGLINGAGKIGLCNNI